MQAGSLQLDMPLDPGIARFVHILRAGGIETFESCQGGDGHACPEPIVRFCGDGAAGFRAFAIAKENGMPVLKVGLVYRVTNEMLLTGPWWEMIFSTMDRAETTCLPEQACCSARNEDD